MSDRDRIAYDAMMDIKYELEAYDIASSESEAVKVFQNIWYDGYSSKTRGM